ncbi:hypothetical protein [Mycobacterium sp. DL592]|uniref:hypothetical protein n=1 Tax=Mycobacterium sp. DL592 TaxID=2675524 RepID=UPI0014216E4C|nr:hypothetical protein [Mycobacterium sp. DL592]
MTAIQTGFDGIAVADVLVSAAKAAGWEVLPLVNNAALATLTTHDGERYVVSIRPDTEDFAARRSINDTATDATNQVQTVLDWFIGTAIKSAEHRGSEGEFTN